MRDKWTGEVVQKREVADDDFRCRFLFRVTKMISSSYSEGVLLEGPVHSLRQRNAEFRAYLAEL